MATYTYTCKECGIINIVSRSVKDTEEIPSCSKCNKPMKRSYEWSGTTFNGDGFYTTDKRK